MCHCAQSRKMRLIRIGAKMKQIDVGDYRVCVCGKYEIRMKETWCVSAQLVKVIPLEEIYCTSKIKFADFSASSCAQTDRIAQSCALIQFPFSAFFPLVPRTQLCSFLICFVFCWFFLFFLFLFSVLFGPIVLRRLMQYVLVYLVVADGCVE